MGMLITLFLISANVYNSVEAPSTRSFSYIEAWMVGTTTPILLGILEYGFVLFLMKRENVIGNANIMQDKEMNIKPVGNLKKRIKRLDYFTMKMSFVYLITFMIAYSVKVSQKNVT